eukprot:gnl/Dysnectes_brevis/2758_a3357_714.p1 GENE.gnl/Dysnectes_brevis/2758_a3357_714~~gnl/Dysnectes_brevis/2758_a3357_714.p1  ORF type:complete len:902 (+),score=170.33 gnl/Dysnectes_brevis/2758_a3357_714:81-2786(+)
MSDRRKTQPIQIDTATVIEPITSSLFHVVSSSESESLFMNWAHDLLFSSSRSFILSIGIAADFPGINHQDILVIQQQLKWTKPLTTEWLIPTSTASDSYPGFIFPPSSLSSATLKNSFTKLFTSSKTYIITENIPALANIISKAGISVSLPMTRTIDVSLSPCDVTPQSKYSLTPFYFAKASKTSMFTGDSIEDRANAVFNEYDAAIKEGSVNHPGSSLATLLAHDPDKRVLGACSSQAMRASLGLVSALTSVDRDRIKGILDNSQRDLRVIYIHPVCHVEVKGRGRKHKKHKKKDLNKKQQFAHYAAMRLIFKKFKFVTSNTGFELQDSPSDAALATALDLHYKILMAQRAVSVCQWNLRHDTLGIAKKYWNHTDIDATRSDLQTRLSEILHPEDISEEPSEPHIDVDTHHAVDTHPSTPLDLDQYIADSTGSFTPLSHYMCFITQRPFRFVKRGDTAAEKEFLTSMRALRSEMLSGTDITIALDCEGQDLGLIHGSLRLLQFARVFPDVDILKSGQHSLTLEDINPTSGYLVECPASSELVEAVKELLSDEHTRLLLFDLTNDVSSLIDAGMMPTDTGVDGGSCRSTILDAQTAFCHGTVHSLLLHTKLSGLASVCSKVEKSIGPVACIGKDLSRSHGGIFSMASLIFGTNAYPMIASSHSFMVRAASDVGMTALAFIVAAERGYIVPKTKRASIQALTEQKLREIAAVADRVTKLVGREHAVLAAPIFRQLKFTFAYPSSMKDLRRIADSYTPGDEESLESIARLSWPAGYSLEQGLKASEARINQLSKALDAGSVFRIAIDHLGTSVIRKLFKAFDKSGDNTFGDRCSVSLDDYMYTLPVRDELLGHWGHRVIGMFDHLMSGSAFTDAAHLLNTSIERSQKYSEDIAGTTTDASQKQ